MFIYGQEIPWETVPKYQPDPHVYLPFDSMKELNPLYLYGQEFPLEGFE